MLGSSPTYRPCYIGQRFFHVRAMFAVFFFEIYRTYVQVTGIRVNSDVTIIFRYSHGYRAVHFVLPRKKSILASNENLLVKSYRPPDRSRLPIYLYELISVSYEWYMRRALMRLVDYKYSVSIRQDYSSLSVAMHQAPTIYRSSVSCEQERNE